MRVSHSYSLKQKNEPEPRTSKGGLKIKLKKRLEMINNILDIADIQRKLQEVENSHFINIMAYDLSIMDWEKMIKHINLFYKVDFIEYLSNKEEKFINYNKLLNYWNGKNENGYMARIYINGITINAYFNSIEILDFDALYKDILEEENLRPILHFIYNLSNIIGKPFFF